MKTWMRLQILLLLLVCGLALALVTGDGRDTARAHPAYAVTWDDVESWIVQDAAWYGVSAAYLRAVAWCESAGDPYAYNPASGAYGPFQFIPRGGIWQSTPWGWQSIYDAPVADQVEAAVWAFSRGYGWQWDCS